MPGNSISRTAATLLALVALTSSGGAQSGPAVRLHWVTNGPVSTGTTLGRTLYVAGAFTRVAPSTDALGALHVVSAADGSVPRRLPLVDGEIRSIVADGTGGAYIGGRFSSVDGTPRSSLAHVLTDGTLDTAFAPVLARTSDAVTIVALLRHNGSLFFAVECCGVVQVNGQSRQTLAAVDPATGATRPFAAAAEADVTALLAVNGALTAVGRTATTFDAAGAALRVSFLPTGLARTALVSGTRLVIGGRFILAGNIERSVIALDIATGTLDAAWPAAGVSDGFAFALLASGSTLYVGGEFSQVLGLPRANLAALDLATGNLTPWAPVAGGVVDALTVSPGGLLVGGDFLSMNGLSRERLAEVDLGGSTTAWQSASAPTAVHAMTVSGGEVLIGGRMAILGGTARRGYAAFDLANDTLLPWAPDTPGRVAVALAADGGTVIIGTENLGDGQPRVAAVAADTGAPLARLTWPAPARIAGIDDGWAYVSSGADLSRAVWRRTRLDTGDPDPSWTAAINPIGIVDGVMYGAVPAAPPRLVGIDLAHALPVPWQVALPEIQGYAGTGDLATDGATAFVTYLDYARPLRIAFDRRSGHQVQWPAALPSPRPTFVRPPSIAAADGVVLVATRRDQPGGAITAYTNDGVERPWTLALSDIPSPDRGERRLLVTPSDVIVLGVERVAPVVHGIAVVPRQPATAPHGLAWTSSGREVSLAWDAPAGATAQVVEVGSQPDRVDVAAVSVGGAATLRAPASVGTFYVRVREGSAPAAPSNPVAIDAGCTAPPPVPTALTAALTPAAVTLRWSGAPVAPLGGYRLEVGRTSGSSDLATLMLGPTTSFATALPPAGTYVLRVRAWNDCGDSAPSAETVLTVGAGALPPAPGAISAVVNGRAVTLQWAAVAGALAYRVEIGTARGVADLGTTPSAAPGLSAAGVPSGAYYVRVRAVSAAGSGPPGPDALVVVP